MPPASAPTASRDSEDQNPGLEPIAAAARQEGGRGFNPSSGVRYWVIATPHRYLVLGQGEGGTSVFWVGSEGGGIGRPRGNRP